MLGFAWLAPICRGALAAARRIVPRESLPNWLESWQGDYWHWMLKAQAYRSADGRSALVAHTVGASRAAFALAIENPETLRRRDYLTGHPAFPPIALMAALLVLIAWTRAIPETRNLIHPPSQPNTNNLVLLSQSGQFLAARRGFTAHETNRFAAQAKTVSSVGYQQWYYANIQLQGKARQTSATNVGPRFFDVLGVKAGFGQLPAADDEFVASYAFWHKELGEAPVGSKYKISGRWLRLTGVLPRDFLFLRPTAIWTAQSFDPPKPKGWEERLYGLKGVIARVKPGVTLAAVEREFFDIQAQRSLGHYTQKVHAQPYALYTTRTAQIYGGGLLGFLALAVVGVIAGFVRAIRAGMTRAVAGRYWALMLAKITVPLAICFVVVIETTGITQQGMLGGVWFGRDLFAIWIFFCGAVLSAFWAWRDQRSRCQVCLHRMRDPIRIGVPGQVLLETTGLELLCPKGHGIIYTPESVLGSEMSHHWLGLEEPAER